MSLRSPPIKSPKKYRTSHRPSTRGKTNAIIRAAPAPTGHSEHQTARISPMGGGADFAKRPRDRRKCVLRRSQLRRGLSSAISMSALDSTDPLILQTALTSPIPVAHVELAIEKSSAEGRWKLHPLSSAIAVIMESPASAKFGEMKRAVKSLLGEPLDTICGYVKGRDPSGGDTGEMPFLYIIHHDEAYLVDGSSPVAETLHRVLC